jgi:hypothetical protein
MSRWTQGYASLSVAEEGRKPAKGERRSAEFWTKLSRDRRLRFFRKEPGNDKALSRLAKISQKWL